MTEKKLDDGLLRDNIHSLFKSYAHSGRTFTELCIIEKIWRDILKEIQNSYR